MNRKNRYITILSLAIFTILLVIVTPVAKAMNGDIYNLTTKQLVSKQSDSVSDRRKFAFSMVGRQNEYGYELNRKIYNYKDASYAVAKLSLADRSQSNKVFGEIFKTKEVGNVDDFNTKLKMDSVNAINDKTIKIVFNIEINPMTVITTNFEIFDKYSDSQLPTKVTLDRDKKTVNLIVETPLDANKAPYTIEVKDELKSTDDKSLTTNINQIELPVEVPTISSVAVYDKNNIIVDFGREIVDATSTPDTLKEHISVVDLSDSTKIYVVNQNTEVISGKVKVSINEDLLPTHNYKVIFTKFAIKDWFGTKNGAVEYLFSAK